MRRHSLLEQLFTELPLDQDARQAFDEEAARLLGLNLTDLRCLGILERRGSVPATELARETGLTTGAMTTSIDRLERAGYVRRVRDERDRRRVFVELTDGARTAIGGIWGPLAREGASVLERFTTDELEVIVRYLRSSRELLSRQVERLREMKSAR